VVIPGPGVEEHHNWYKSFGLVPVALEILGSDLVKIPLRRVLDHLGEPA
jgi:hypothetical protein